MYLCACIFMYMTHRSILTWSVYNTIWDGLSKCNRSTIPLLWHHMRAMAFQTPDWFNSFFRQPTKPQRVGNAKSIFMSWHQYILQASWGPIIFAQTGSHPGPYDRIQQKGAHVCTFPLQNAVSWDICLMNCGIWEMVPGRCGSVFVELPSGECDRIPLLIRQHWFW